MFRNFRYGFWRVPKVLKLGTVAAALPFFKLSADEPIQFNRDVRPILSGKCFSCHGPGGHPKAGLRLDTFEGATEAGRKGGAAIIPEDPEGSLLVRKIFSKDADEVMPPPESHKVLTDMEKGVLAGWIRQGAEYERHWSFIPPKPSASGESIDTFVRRRLEAEGWQPQPEADKRTLIRRVSLDLTGLPPTPEEVRAFLDDNSPQAYEHLVDRLLASPRYGEHMAKYWLDLVRYGDSHGIHADNYREMFPYRDWVIRAFNTNQPFDQFTIDQVAGDLRPSPTTAQLVASGFNRLHISNSAGSALEAELYVNNVIDRVNAIGTVYLGLTLACAACHDHKFDPVTQKEYYQLFAFFNNLDGPPDNKGQKSPAPYLAIPTVEQSARVDELQRRIAGAGDSQELQKELAALKKQFPTTLIMKERESPRKAYVLIRGEYDNQGEEVSRALPAFLPPMPDGAPMDRMGFAQWLVDPGHPLFARVAVNRFWQQLFGVGLAKTSEDLGSQGEWPSHPGLLDFLATRFIGSGWDVKALMKDMVMSRTYHQRSDAGAESYARDLGNRLLSRGPRFRMDSEMLRDQALFVSGQLVETMYGPSVKPPQPPGLWKSVSLPGVSMPDRFTPDKGEATMRRSVYTYIKRAFPPPAMSIFNAPNRETCIARRERTNTPLQALVLMNERQFFDSARKLAAKTLAGKGDDRAKINQAFEWVASRPCTPMEMQLLQDGLEGFREHFKGSPDAELRAWTMVMNSLLNLDIVKNKQ